jgi:hypothetical protein
MPTPDPRQQSKHRRSGSVNSSSGLCAIRVREIERLFRHRYGRFLPDDDAGRDDLAVLLEHVLRFKDGREVAPSFVRRWAPWMSDNEAAAAIELAATTFRIGRADEVAERLGLTFDERMALGITTVGARDVDAAERARRYREREAARKRAKRRERKQAAAERRGAVMQRTDLSGRARDLFGRLSASNDVPLSAVVRTWTDGPVGALGVKSRHTALARAADELLAAGLIAERREKARNGIAVRLVRRVADDMLTVAHTRQTSARKSAADAASVMATWRHGDVRGTDEVVATEAENYGNPCAASTSYGDTECVRGARKYGDNDRVRGARDTASAAYTYVVADAGPAWSSAQPYKVEVVLADSPSLPGGAPCGAPAQTVEKDSPETSASTYSIQEAARDGVPSGDVAVPFDDPNVPADDVPLAEPEPNPASVLDILARGPKAAPPAIVLVLTTGEVKLDTGPGPQPHGKPDAKAEPPPDPKPEKRKTWADLAAEVLNERAARGL